jgi:hypothetical protein
MVRMPAAAEGKNDITRGDATAISLLAHYGVAEIPI